MLHSRIVGALLGASLCLGCGSSWSLPAQPTSSASGQTSSTSPPADLERASEVARSRLRGRLSELPGLAVAVGRNGEIVWSEGLGVADLETRRPVSAGTRFRIYSVAKPITATLAVRLHERGMVDLDMPIGATLHGLSDELAGTTLAQLLSHTAGVHHYRSGEWERVSRRHCTTALEAIEPFQNDPLLFAPGTDHAYSSYGFVLASAVLEAASGVPFAELLEREILAPAGMHDTVVDAPPYDPATTASFYRSGFLGRVRAEESWDNSCKLGSGGLLSTAADLVRFGLALSGGKLLGPEGVELLFRSRTAGSDSEPAAALGWILLPEPGEGSRLAVQSGGSPGGRSYLLLDLDRRIVVALAANLEGESLQKEAKTIARLIRRDREQGAG